MYLEINIKKTLLIIITSYLLFSVNIYPTPSTQIWIPSTDIQPYKTIHLGIDNYFTVFTRKSDGAWIAPVDVGITYGLFPNVEFGFDILEPSDYPFYLNVKTGIDEGKLSKSFPAFAAGIYGVGTKKNETDLNIIYVLISKVFRNTGRFSIGYYTGNENLLYPDKNGILFSFDRYISEKLWFCIDYQGGKNSFGALNIGFSWNLSEKASIVVGYDIYNISNIKNTVTTQIDINF